MDDRLAPREYFSRSDIEDLIRREMPIYDPETVIEWNGDGSAVAIPPFPPEPQKP